MTRPPSFRAWLRGHVDQPTAVGDLARDVRTDRAWPTGADVEQYHAHLDAHSADDGAHDALTAAWGDYQHHLDHIRPTSLENAMPQHPIDHLRHLISDRAALLNFALDTGTCRDGYERALADEVFARIVDADAALNYLVNEKLSVLIAVDCLLDECAAQSYDTVQKLTDTLTAAIQAQDNTPAALRSLIEDAIADTARLERTIAEIR